MIWLLLAHVTLASGERVDLLISSHSSEIACLGALIRAPGRPGRRYDCRPLVADSRETTK